MFLYYQIIFFNGQPLTLREEVEVHHQGTLKGEVPLYS
jgi:hypothetical protein